MLVEWRPTILLQFKYVSVMWVDKRSLFRSKAQTNCTHPIVRLMLTYDSN